ncbi:MAG: SRPBCC family protein [Treponema sp.]|nr:SRPBCC family protein [Treponema sp.]
MENDDFTINAQMLIRKPAPEVFAAFVEPERTRNFWFTGSSGPLEEGGTVRWEWEMYGVSAEIRVIEVVRNRLIKVEWEDPIPMIEFRFAEHGPDATYVTILNYGHTLTGRELLETVVDKTAGFTTVLDGLKAYLEHGIRLNLIGDKFPAGLPPGGPASADRTDQNLSASTI